jgi:hypothetical protein
MKLLSSLLLFFSSIQNVKALHVVSDYDDTLRMANVRNPVDAAWRFASGNDNFYAGYEKLFSSFRKNPSFRLSVVSGFPEFAYQRIFNRIQEALGFAPNELVLKTGFEDVFDYKVDRISALIEKSLDHEFLFLGDNGEKDQEVYLKLKDNHAKLAGSRFYIHKVMDRPELLGLSYYLSPFEVAYAESLGLEQTAAADAALDLAKSLLQSDPYELIPDFAHCPKRRRDWFFDCTRSAWAPLNAACEELQAHYFELCTAR